MKYLDLDANRGARGGVGDGRVLAQTTAPVPTEPTRRSSATSDPAC